MALASLPHPDSRPFPDVATFRGGKRIQCRQPDAKISGECPNTVWIDVRNWGTAAFDRRAVHQSCGISEWICNCGALESETGGSRFADEAPGVGRPGRKRHRPLRISLAESHGSCEARGQQCPRPHAEDTPNHDRHISACSRGSEMKESSLLPIPAFRSQRFRKATTQKTVDSVSSFLQRRRARNATVS